MTDKDRLIELEVRLTYQQKLIDELNAVVTEHTLKVLKLEKLIQDIASQSRQLRTQLDQHLPNLPHEKPPHY